MKTKLTDADIIKRFETEQDKIKKERNIEFFGFSKQILLLSTTLITLMIAFHKLTQNYHNNILLNLSIFFFGLNILLALIVLHGKIRNFDKSINLLEESKKLELVERLNEPAKNYVPFDKGVVYGANILYFSFFLSVLSLCLYGITSLT
jgi:hypothetical protein